MDNTLYIYIYIWERQRPRLTFLALLGPDSGSSPFLAPTRSPGPIFEGWKSSMRVRASVDAPIRSVFKMSSLFLRPRLWQFEI